MAHQEVEDLDQLHIAIKEKKEGEIEHIKERYEKILGGFEVERKHGGFKGLKGDEYAQASV